MEKEKNGFALLYQFILTFIGLGYIVYDLIANSNYIFDIISIVIYALMIVYSLVLYKKPHGNHLRYLMLSYAISLIILIGSLKYNVLYSISTGFAALLISYMAGRLDKLSKNKLVITIIGALLLAAFFGYLSNFSEDITNNPVVIFNKLAGLAQIIQFATVAIAYVSMFEAHKKAGETK